MTEAVAWVALAFSLLALGFSLCPRRVNEDPDGPAGTEPVRLNSIVTYGVDIPAAGEPEKDTTEVSDTTMTPLPVYFGRYGATRARLHALAMVHPKDEEAG